MTAGIRILRRPHVRLKPIILLLLFSLAAALLLVLLLPAPVAA